MARSALIAFAALACAASAAQASDPVAPERLELRAEDGVPVIADVYRAPGPRASTPWIVLAHQAMSSRGEYRAIGPRLAALGYNAVAIDQRSGRFFGTTVNETMIAARERRLPVGFIDAAADVLAGVAWADAQSDGPVALWGSSYSASLAIVLAARDPQLVDAVIAMSPGEFLQSTSVAAVARDLTTPTLIASAAAERSRWREIYEAIPVGAKTAFAPETGGAHGSSALIVGRTDNAETYWRVVETFLDENLSP